MKKIDLSDTMKRAIMHAQENGGGILHRIPGGFWVVESDKTKVPHCAYVGTPTVEALVRRGAAEYTEWKTRSKGGGDFPITVKMRKD